MTHCLVCYQNFSTATSLSRHLKREHSLTPENYYNKFYKLPQKCQNCDNFVKFQSITKGYREFCSTKCSANNKQTIGKRNKTNIKRYGHIVPIHNKEIRKKVEQKWKDNYGVNNPLKAESVKEKIKQTNIIRYGCENVRQLKEVNEKVKQTCIDKYGVSCSLQSLESIKKKKETWLKNLGVDNPSKNKEIKKQKKEIYFNKFFPTLLKKFSTLNLKLIDNYVNSTSTLKVKCLKCNTIFETTYFNIMQYCGRCPNCYPKYKSTGELEIKEFIKNLFTKVIDNSRNLIPPYELDIYIPEKKVAIEYNGLYWHSEELKDKFYHLNKLKDCFSKNIQLIQIFEDEWLFKQDIVKARLKQILNVNDSTKIHARSCNIKEIVADIKNEFLIKYHLQGQDTSPIKLGAFYNNELVSVMTFSKGNIAKGFHFKENIWELNRFCNNYNYHIPGIASKLLTYFKRKYQWKEIYSYADRRWSTGNLYYKLGFELEKETQPNYWYVKGLKRIHRFSLRKRPDEPKDIPEWVLRLEEGYIKIWDCGHLKFIDKIKN